MSQQFPRETWFALSRSMQRNLCRGRSRIRKLAVERLEDRQLMAADFIFPGEGDASDAIALDSISVADPVVEESAPPVESIDADGNVVHLSPTPEQIKLESLETIQIPGPETEGQRPLTPGEEAYRLWGRQKSELIEQRRAQQAGDRELINRLDPQPAFTEHEFFTDAHDASFSRGAAFRMGRLRQILRIGDDVYFQTIRPGGLGDIGVYDGHTIKYLGLNVPLGGEPGADGQPIYYLLDNMPGQFAEFQGKLFFVAEAPEFGRELYSYDGERVQVYDLTPGEQSSRPRDVSSDVFMTFAALTHFGNAQPAVSIVQGTLYFRIYGPEGNELVRFDGTNWSRVTMPADEYIHSEELADGSLLLRSTKGMWPDYQESAYILNSQGLHKLGGDDFEQQRVLVRDGQVYLLGYTAEFGRELYHWDGTELQVLDLTLGPDSTADLPEQLGYWSLYKDARGHLILRNDYLQGDFGVGPGRFGQYIDFDGTSASLVQYTTVFIPSLPGETSKLLSRTELGERSFQSTGFTWSSLPFAELDPNAIDLELVSEVVTPPEELIHGTAYPPMESIDVVTNNPIELPEIGETPPAPEETSVAPPETISETPLAPPAKADEEESYLPLVMVVDVPTTESQEAPEEATSESSESTESLDAVFTSLNTSLIDNSLIDPFISHSDDEGSSDEELFAEDATAEDLLGESV